MTRVLEMNQWCADKGYSKRIAGFPCLPHKAKRKRGCMEDLITFPPKFSVQI